MRARGSGRRFLRYFDVTGQQVSVTRLAGTRLARQLLDHTPLGKVPQRALYSLQILERMEALGAGAQFARGLRTAQHQDADQGGLAPPQIQGLGGALRSE